MENCTQDLAFCLYLLIILAYFIYFNNILSSKRTLRTIHPYPPFAILREPADTPADGFTDSLMSSLSTMSDLSIGRGLNFFFETMVSIR